MHEYLHVNHNADVAGYICLPYIIFCNRSNLEFFAGLMTAAVSSEVFKAAQPALLYLVPFTLLPLFLMAYLKVLFFMLFYTYFSYMRVAWASTPPSDRLFLYCWVKCCEIKNFLKNRLLLHRRFFQC